MNTPRIVDADAAQNALARKVCRQKLDEAVAFCARELMDQPLSIKQLMARLLIEDLAALDVDATGDWLDANIQENVAGNATIIDDARQLRRDAFTRLAQAAIAKGQTA